MAAACTEHITRRDDFRAATGIERHAQAGRIVFDQCHLDAEFNLQAETLQMVAENCLGTPLRKAALKFIPAADTGQVRGRDLPQPRT